MSDNLKILIVDDLEDNRDVVKSILRNIEGIEISEAENGKIAIEIVDKIVPEIVIMDIMMPEMDGFEATKIIKEKYPEIIVIVVTAVEDSDMEVKMIDAGATAYIKKPINSNIFKYKIKNFLNLINLKRYSKSKFFNRNAINPFSQEIRNLKTFYTVENEDDMMDFGTWLIDFYHRFNPTASMLFHKKLEFLYKVMTDTLKKQEILNIIIEDGFDELYINFEISKNISLNECSRDVLNIISNDVIINNNFIHMRIRPNKKEQEKKNENDFSDINKKSAFEDKETIKSAKEIVKIDEYDRTLLRQSHVDKVHAKDFVAQIEGAIIDEIHDLVELEEHWDEYLDKYELKPESKILIEISDILSKYSSIVNSLYSFMALSYALSSLSSFLRSLKVENLDEKINKKLVLLLRSMKSDLSDWRINIFEEQNTSDIHYLDSSLLSSCMQIEALLTNTDIEDEEENDLELF